MNDGHFKASRWLLILTFAAVSSLIALRGEAAEPAARAKNTGAKKRPGPKVDDLGLIPGGIEWQAKFESALELAKRQNKPLMVDFETDWCGFCKKLDRETYGNEQVISFVRQFFVSVKVDGDLRKDLKEKYAIEGYPTVVFLSPYGVELKRIIGFRPPKDFLEEAGKAARSSSTLKKLREEAVAAPDDADAQRALARALFAAGNSVEALTVLKDFTKKHPTVSTIRLDLADILKADGKLEEACSHYEAVLKTSAARRGAKGDESTDEKPAATAYLPAYLSLARTRLKLKHYEKGIGILTQLLTLQPDRPQHLEALFLRSYAYATLGRAEAALADLKAAEKLDTDGFWGLRASLIRELVEDEPRTR